MSIPQVAKFDHAVFQEGTLAKTPSPHPGSPQPGCVTRVDTPDNDEIDTDIMSPEVVDNLVADSPEP